MPNRRTVLAAAGVTLVLAVAMVAFDRADEDSALGTLADWSWWAFCVSALVLVVVAVLALVGKARSAESRPASRV